MQVMPGSSCRVVDDAKEDLLTHDGPQVDSDRFHLLTVVAGGVEEEFLGIRQHDVDGHDAESSIVDRHDRTVPAPVLAAAAGFGIAHHTALVWP